MSDLDVRRARWRSACRPLVALVALVALSVSSFVLAAGPAGATPTPLRKVAVFASDSATITADVQHNLAASGDFAQVTTLPESGCGAHAPSLAELQQYDAVYVWSNCRFQTATDVGNVLADYADGGGVVVVAAFAAYSSGLNIGGRFATEGYLPTTTGAQTGGTRQSLVADLAADPLLAGVGSFNGGSVSWHNSSLQVTAGSTLVAHWTDGQPLVAYRDNVVELNFYPPSDAIEPGYWDSSTDGVQLMINALNHPAKPKQVAPTFTSEAGASFSAGSTGSFTVETSGLPTAAITESGALPDGVTLVDNGNGTATLSGTPKVGTGGAYSITLTATNGAAPDATQNFTLGVTEAPVITSLASAGFTVGSDGSFAVSTTPGYPASTTLTETGTLPDGVTFVDNHNGTATLHGTPANGSAGSYPITVTAANSAESRTQDLTLTVSLAAQTVTFTSTPPVPAAAVGQTYTVAATGADPAEPVQFAVDISSAGACTIQGTTVTFRHPGSCMIDAIQAGDGHYAPAVSSQTVAVTRAATTTALTVRSTGLSATVSPVAPDSGTPTGTVTFSVDGAPVGTAPVVHGSARLSHRVPSGHSRAVAAVYSGDDDFAGSSASTARRDPTVTATVSAAKPRSAYGWYRTPVTVTFHCTPRGATLTRPCPAPVTLTSSGAGQSVTRTVLAADGGAATVTVRGINIDRQAPRVAVAGIANRATYPGQAPKARCAGSDAVSGIAHCTLTRHVAGERVSVTATATDRAGNVRTATVRYTMPRFYIAGAAYRHGAYQVREGRSYLVVALTSGTARPRYFNVAPHGLTPTASPRYLQRSGQQSGLHRYTALVRIDRGLGRYRYWDMGVKSAGTVHRIVFQPSR